MTATVHMRIDEQGKVMVDSIVVTGIGYHAFVRDVKAAAAKYEYKPAVLEGCAVSARTNVSIHIQ